MLRCEGKEADEVTKFKVLLPRVREVIFWFPLFDTRRVFQPHQTPLCSWEYLALLEKTFQTIPGLLMEAVRVVRSSEALLAHTQKGNWLETVYFRAME